jgi:hypothetical protein
MNSEQYIEQKLNEVDFGNVKVYEINDLRTKKKKQLLNAARTIGQGVNQNLIIGVVDDTLLGSGKGGVVFTGKTIYIRLEQGSLSGQINLSDFKNVTYKEDSHFNDNGKLIDDYILSWDDGSQQSLTSNSSEIGDIFSGISDLLENFTIESNEIQETNHNLALSDLNEKAICQYLKVIYLYLNSDNGFSEKDSRNYAEIETRLDVSEEVDAEMRQYRFSNSNDSIFDEFTELKNLIPEGSRDLILQSLINDILSTFDDEKLDSWKDDEILLKIAEKANISEDKVSLIVASQKFNHDLMDDKLTRDEYKERLQKIKEISASLGVSSVTSVATLALTGAVVSIAQLGVSDVGLGLTYLTLGTGGLGLAALGVGAASVAAYKGVERLIKSNDTQESMRIEMLQNKIKKLMGSQSVIIKDINYLSDVMIQAKYSKNKLSKQSTDNEQHLSGSEAAIDQILLTLKKCSSAGTKVDTERRERERQLIIAKLPAQIDFEKLHDLVTSHTLGEDIESQILKSYDKNGKLRSNQALVELEALSKMLDSIEYNKKVTVANAKSVAKSTRKKTQSAVEAFKKDENVQKAKEKTQNALNSFFKGF